MRLTSKEVSAIKDFFKSNLKEFTYSLYLFGSRVDDAKRGGDIDLLLKVKSKDFNQIKKIKSQLKFDLEYTLGEQRVDLTVCTDETLEHDEFLSSLNDRIEL